MPKIGHNGGPAIKLTDKARLDLVRKIVQSQLPAAQKLLSIGVAVLSNQDGEVALGAEAMKRITSTSKRDTVFDAKRALAEDGLQIIATVVEPGKANRYRIMSPSVVAEIVAAYERQKPVPQNGTSTRPPDRGVTHPETVDVTRHQNGTSPVPQIGTGQTPRVPARVKGLPSEVVISRVDSPPTPSHVQPVSNWRSAFGADEDPDICFVGGKLTLLNGARGMWLDRFGGDDVALDLALIEAAGSIQRGSNSSLRVQVERRLAGIVRDTRDRDRRYQAAVERNARGQSPGSKEGSTSRTMRIAKMLEDQGGRA